MGGTITKKLIRRGALLLGLGLGIAGFAGEAQAQGCVNTPGFCQLQFNLPDCYVCDETINDCVPDDSFCNGISGGNEDNQCRAGECLVVTFQDPNNPSGCDYSLDTGGSVDCRNCIPQGLATLENCGNGICEPDEGEACDTCAVDCLLPGFPAGTCPLTSGTVIADACSAPPPGIVFDGPPYNEPFSQDCEDGDLCTDNACSAAAAVCTVTPKSCSQDTADFCCAGGCQAPPAGLTCAEADAQGILPRVECDIDCYIPEQCIPTPSPTPPPVFAGCLEGGGGWGEKNGPGCGGAACALNPAASAVPGLGLAFSLAGLFGFGAYRNLRRRRD
ncbi:hypothetical protein FBR05_08700 [Deltaproteobacteria bacterium PRO3]|nr:hypothetical protein [Deltaproteobacteria bacterium PRO3]